MSFSLDSVEDETLLICSWLSGPETGLSFETDGALTFTVTIRYDYWEKAACMLDSP